VVELAEYEKAILSLMLRRPGGDNRVSQRVIAELGDDKFSVDAHKQIFRAISEVVLRRGIPDIMTVATELGPNLESVGDKDYLQSLKEYLGYAGLGDGEGFEQWIRVVDSAGRLRHLGLIVEKYARMYQDFEALLRTVKDVDDFIANFVTTINSAVSGTRSSYKHISVAVEQEREHRRDEKRGEVVDLINCGFPSIEKFFIPRPQTLGIIAGISSMGKTQLALQLVLGTAIHLKENNLPGVVALNELEMVGWRVNRRLACSLAGVDSSALARNEVPEHQEKRYNDVLDYIAELPIYYDDNPNITSAEFSWQSIAMHIEHGKRVLGVGDYIELFKDKGDSEELRVSNVVRGHRHVCWETGACEILISQFSNAVFATSDKIGGVGKTRYSGAISHAADWFIEVWNPPQMMLSNIDFDPPEWADMSYAYVLVQKNKDHAVGNTPLFWTPEFTQFRDPSLPMGVLYKGMPKLPKPKTDF
jgi:replicative DNA helicase